MKWTVTEEITSTKYIQIKLTIQNSLQTTTQAQMTSLMNSNKLKEEIIPIPHNLLHKIKAQGIS